MKIALLNDTHFGCRNDSPAFISYQNRFYDELFFPYLIENKIDTLIHLGDVVDRRKFINFNTAHNFQKKFWKRLWDLKIDTHIILGNHDTYYKNTNEDNSIADICFGHLEIKGFEMHKGVMNDHGLERDQFKRFEKVISGHFHKKSDDGHVYYLGTQYQIMWSDHNCPKGFHIFDTETRELERIPNPLVIFKKLIYDDRETDYTNFDLTPYENCFVKMFVSYKTNESMYNKLVESFYNKTNIHELQIIEDPIDIKQTVRSDILDQGEDTMTFLNNYIDQIDTDLDKNKLKNITKELYVEANE